MSDISVIIPINEINETIKGYLVKCVESINKQSVKPDKVYVVHADTKEVNEFFKTWETPEELNIEVVVNKDKTDFCSQVNCGVEKVETEWFSVLEVDDEYAKSWFKNTKTYMEAYDDVDIFLPLVVDVDEGHNFLGFTNESIWAMKFSEKMGELDNNTLLNYQNYQTSGAIIKKESYVSVGMLKSSMRLTFVYEFLLRATYNDFRIMTIPKIGYKHMNMRENSLFWDYKNDPKEKISPEEAAFWVEQAKKEYFFTYDRAIEYGN
jgi:glycosyltransferase involved in cell wall biosynthesis|tara:strand:- start:2515 stop:3306 length:792 start_codon:yes stop_codon:yes gene_type:complete